MAEKPDEIPCDFTVRVAKRTEDVRFSVMMFNGMDNVDISKWTADSMVTMEREDNRGVVLASQTVQEYGEGSEYGKAAREEARRKKFGRQSKSYKLDNQPWRLGYKEPDGRYRQMRGTRGSGANEHADYWVFLKPSGSKEFKACKVDEWHKFLPAITHKTLDCEQAEEQYLQRNKVMNQFALKAAIQKQLNGADDAEMTDQQKRLLKIKDNGSSDDSDDGDNDGEGEEGKKKKKKKGKKPARDKRQRVENSDEVAKYESSDGEDEGREYDYISDSGTDSDREQVPSDETIEKQLVGVTDEEGARKMFESDSDESDDDLAKKLLKQDGDKKKNNDVEERDSSGSDSDDPDTEKLDSVVFLPKKETKDGEGSSSGKKRSAVDDGALKNDALGPNDPKKAKTAAKFEEGLNEETVRRYLRRKPHTTKELLHKMNGKCGDMSKSEMVTRLAAILKAIEPHQSKQLKGKKEVLFFSLTNTVA